MTKFKKMQPIVKIELITIKSENKIKVKQDTKVEAGLKTKKITAINELSNIVTPIILKRSDRYDELKTKLLVQ